MRRADAAQITQSCQREVPNSQQSDAAAAELSAGNIP
jgi:hypothetical protein